MVRILPSVFSVLSPGENPPGNLVKMQILGLYSRGSDSVALAETRESSLLINSSRTSRQGTDFEKLLLTEVNGKGGRVIQTQI